MLNALDKILFGLVIVTAPLWVTAFGMAALILLGMLFGIFTGDEGASCTGGAGECSDYTPPHPGR